MKTFQKNIKLYMGLAAFALVASCKPEIDNDLEPTPNVNVDFSKYIAIGNSLTAGFADGGLYLDGQQNSFPNMIAQQMKSHGGGEFNTPFFSEAQSNGSGYIRLKSLEGGSPAMEPVTDKLAIRGLNPQKKPLYAKYTGEINNFGVPGMRLDMAFAPGMGTQLGNPYFERLLPDNEPATSTYMGHTTSQNHTFFSFSLGNNDVLGYATNGAFEDGNPLNNLTSVATFEDLYSKYIGALTIKSQKGVVSTIPDVTAVPFFSTVTTDLLNASLKKLDPKLQIYIRTAKEVRPATSEDLFALNFPTDTLGKEVIPGNQNTRGFGLSPLNPLSDKFVLDKDEVIEVKNIITKYNTHITKVAGEKGLAVADIHSFLNKMKNGDVINGVVVSNKFITGNVFSLDGIHLTPMGYAIMANLFIDAINSKYGTKLAKIDITQYRGVKMP